MENLYTLTAKHDPNRENCLTIRYEERKAALAAARTLKEHCAIVTVVGPDGLEVKICSTDLNVTRNR
jgi:hypothetical protein